MKEDDKAEVFWHFRLWNLAEETFEICKAQKAPVMAAIETSRMDKKFFTEERRVQLDTWRRSSDDARWPKSSLTAVKLANTNFFTFLFTVAAPNYSHRIIQVF